MTQKYEFKDIKDVDLSKLEGKERYTCLVGGVATILTGNSLKLGIFNVETILLPCSPIVETDKLNLSGSKEVEVSDEEIEKLFNKFRLESSVMSFVMSKESFKRGFEECAKLLMRDKQGIAPKEVEEK